MSDGSRTFNVTIMSSTTSEWQLEDVLHYLKVLSRFKKKRKKLKFHMCLGEAEPSWLYPDKYMGSAICPYTQKAHTDICWGTHPCTRTNVLAIITTIIVPPADVNMPTAFVNRPLSYTRCQSSSSLTKQHHGVQPRWTGPPAALQHELLTPTIMQLASIQPAFSPPSFYLSLAIHNTSIYGLKHIHHSEYSMYPLPPFMPPPNPTILV